MIHDNFMWSFAIDFITDTVAHNCRGGEGEAV
jgi:hypothetical protein